MCELPGVLDLLTWGALLGIGALFAVALLAVTSE